MASTTVTSVTVASAKTGPLKAGDILTFTLDTSGPVFVTGTPRLVLSNGAFASYVGSDTSGRPIFSYTVAVGDTNTDALAVSGLNTQTGKIAGPTPHISFATATSVSVGNNPFSLAVADVNGDGKQDLLTANYFSNSVSVRLGDGKGGFSGTTSVAVGSNPASIALGDFNGDGKLDFATANNGNATVSVRLGDGTGGFSGGRELTVDPNPISIVAGDLNGDGKTDLFTANYDSASISVRIADGTSYIFARYSDVPVAGSPRSVTAADVNGDGRLDLISADYTEDTASVYLGNGSGSFFASTTVDVGDAPTSVTTADLNGDGKLDLLTANNGSSTVSVRLGDGSGGFSGSTEVSVGTSPRSVVVADVNGDGHLDFVTSNYSSGTLSLRRGNGKGAFSGTTEITVGFAPTAVSVVDVNGDGKPDLLATNYGDNNVSVVLNTSTFPAPFDASSISGATGALTGRKVDTVAPAAPVLALSTDTGASDTDNVTRSAAITLSRIEQGTVLRYSVDGGKASTSYDPIALGDGNHTVAVTQTDRAGNVSSRGTITFTLDRAAAAPLPLLASDTGASAVDKLTRNAALKLLGVEQGARLSYVVDGGAASATYNPAKLADGEHSVVVTQTDLAGNVSSFGALTFTLDRKAPSVAAVTTSGPGLTKGSGILTTGERAVFTLTLSEAVVKAAAAAPVTLTLSNGATAHYLASASDAKHLAFAYTVKLQDTATDLSVKAVDLNGATLNDQAGNTASLSGAVTNPVGTLKIDGFTGTDGSDIFKGKSGAQTFKGLAGNDSYTVDDKGDKIVELAKGGTDKVLASVSFALSANVEALTLTGKAKIDATGNELANALSGNGAANTLKGLAGNDTLKGFGGSDRLIGGAGADDLFGGDGADTFVFAKLSDSTVSLSGRDTIFDFGAGDRIDLSAIDANGKIKGDAAFVWIGSAEFHGKAGELRYEKGKSDTFVYGDTNGDKQADIAIHLDDALKLVKADFLL